VKDNTLVGAFAGYNLGSTSASTYADNNTLFGSRSGFSIINGSQNTFFGSNVAYSSDSVSSSVMIGYRAGSKARRTYSNIFIGDLSGDNAGSSGNSTYKDNIFIGHYAGSGTSPVYEYYGTGSSPIKTKGSGNVYLGNYAGQYSTTINGYEYTAGQNTFLGTYAGQNNMWDNNTYIGYKSGQNSRQATGNTFIGEESGINNSTGSSNVFVGRRAGRYAQGAVNNVFIGHDAGINIADSSGVGSSVAIGTGARVTESYCFILGNQYMKVGIGNTAPQNKLEITSATTNTSGLRFTNLKSTSTPSTANSLALSVDANGDVILVPAATGGLTNPVTNLQVQSGTAGESGLKLNNLPLSTTAGAANGKTLSVDATGNVILVTAPAGFTNPVTNLQVQSGTAGVSGLILNNVNSASTTTAANGKALSVDATGNVILVPVTTPVIPAGADVWDQLTNGADYLIRNKNNKSVMIGTVAAAKTSIDYKLYVEKGILAEKVKVSVQANWPDYVFGKNYSLMPLKEVENYITTNNHLPEVPSAEVIAKDGLDLGKMDATLLKKVEELTLYLIEQNKKIEVLQNELNTLKAKK
jgi:trimeric autotransporter adhesin